MTKYPAPTPTKASEEYWERTIDEELAIQRCTVCGEYIFYPRNRCPECLSDELEYRTVEGRGTVVSYTTVHRAPSAHLRELAPYVHGIVELTEGPRMLTTLEVDSEADLAVGMPMEVTFAETVGKYKLPCFEPTGEEQ